MLLATTNKRLRIRDLPLRPARRALLGALPLNLILLSPAPAQELDKMELEEIVVTGSYIQRERFDMASPIEVIGGVQVQETGQVSIGQFIRDLPYTANVDTVANVLDVGDGTQSSDSARFNLRGLGTTSTLTLFDGRRALESNSVNTLVPDIAIDRVEIVLDGGSALYGTDAVAGVVNIVPVKRYQGVKVNALYNQDQDNDFHESQASILAGATWGDLDVVTAFSFHERSLLLRSDRPEFLRVDTDESTSGNPGTFRQLAGAALPDSGVDPSCGQFNGTATDDGIAGSFPSGRRIGSNCIFDFGEFQDYARPAEEYNSYTNLSYALNDDVTLEMQANFTYRTSDVLQSPSTAGTLNHRFLVIPASHPANPFGVDVRPVNWRPFTKLGTLPSFLDDDGYLVRPFKYWTDRYKLGSTYQFGSSSWSGETWASYQTFRTRNEDYLLSFSRLQAAFNGLGGTNGNQYFNPFGSADPRSPSYVAGVTDNSQDVVDSLYIKEKYESRREEFWYVESIVTGDLWQLPTGPLKSAFGAQLRDLHVQTRPTNLSASSDNYISSIVDDPPEGTNTHNQVAALFMEVDVPLLTNLSLQAALRYEDFKDLDLDATKPKLSLRYTPIETLALRASYGESFLAPTPAQKAILRQTGCGEVFTGSDPFNVNSPSVLIGARQCTTGNPNLDPEESEIINAGFTWRPRGVVEGLELSLDYQTIDYDGRIIQLSTQDMVNRDFANFLAANNLTAAAYNAQPLATRQGQLTAWIANGMDPLIIRSATGLNVQQVSRVWENVASLQIGLFDFRTRYSLDLSAYGFMTTSLATTYFNKYEYESTPGAAPVDAKGKQNANTNIVPPLPSFKHNLRVDWGLGMHSAAIAATYLSSVKFDASNNITLTGIPSPSRIDSLTTVDIRYSYRFENVMNAKLLLALGANNVFDARPDPLPINDGFESRLHDPFGRTMYLELTLDFNN